MKTKHMTPLHLTKLIGRQPLRHSFLLITLALACFALAPARRAFGVSPAPDGGYTGGNTAEGTNALFNLTTGSGNTANGYVALFSNTTGSNNTANGKGALDSNTTGSDNTANGAGALFHNTTAIANTANGFQALGNNTTGTYNTGIGANALDSNTTGNQNTAIGLSALYHNTTGSFNTATSVEALFSNTTGVANTANGELALFSNTTANANTATGYSALFGNTTGALNTASGYKALYRTTTGSENTANGLLALFSNTTGALNIALGECAGQNLTTGSNNINVGNPGAAAAESNIIRIGTVVAFTDIASVMHPAHSETFIAGINGVAVTGAAVVVNSSGQLGVAPSSERFKDEIKPMDRTSEAILALKPVTFRYKHELDPKGIPQFGLVAEQVEKVNPDLVTHDEKGQIYTVRYEAVNAMLLNEFLKAHRRAQQQEATITELKSAMVQQRNDFEATTALQQKEIQVLTASLKEQAAQIQKVSARLEVSKAAPEIVLNNQ
jgi:hypothetical protein